MVSACISSSGACCTVPIRWPAHSGSASAQRSRRGGKSRRRCCHRHACVCARAWKIFFTFNLVNLAWIFFRVPSLRQGFTIVERIFTHWQPWQLFDGTLYQLGLSRHGFWMVVCGALLMLAVSLLHRKIEIRKTIAQFPLPLRWAVYMGGLLIILLFGVYGLGYNAESFIYQTF